MSKNSPKEYNDLYGHLDWFRRKVVRYAESHTVREAAEEHGVSVSSVYNWKIRFEEEVL